MLNEPEKNVPPDLPPRGRISAITIVSFVMALIAAAIVFVPLPLAIGAASELALPLFMIMAPVLALIAIVGVFVCHNRGLPLALVGLFLPIVLMFMPVRWFPALSEFYSQMLCGTYVKGIGNGIAAYQKNFDGRFPDSNKWCDLLVEHADIPPKMFSLDAHKDGISFVALNPNAAPDSPPDMVLVFECKPGWNQHGGPELLDPNRHKGIGCNILFKDLHVEFVPAERLNSLRWSADPRPPSPGE